MGDNTVSKKRGKKDLATAQATTRKHKARRSARNAQRIADCATVRRHNADVRKADKATPIWRDISRRVRRVRKARKAGAA